MENLRKIIKIVYKKLLTLAEWGDIIETVPEQKYYSGAKNKQNSQNNSTLYKRPVFLAVTGLFLVFMTLVLVLLMRRIVPYFSRPWVARAHLKNHAAPALVGLTASESMVWFQKSRAKLI